MNFISQGLADLTTGGKIYILFQFIYILCGCFFLYVQWQILKELKKRNSSYTKKYEDRDFTYHDDLEFRNRGH